MTPEVRRALAMGLDRKTICEAAVPSKPQPALAFVPHGIPYEGKTDDFRTVVGDLISEDKEAAKQLLADAGYPNGEGLPTLKFIKMCIRDSHSAGRGGFERQVGQGYAKDPGK